MSARWEGWERATDLHRAQLADALAVEPATWPELIDTAWRIVAASRRMSVELAALERTAAEARNGREAARTEAHQLRAELATALNLVAAQRAAAPASQWLTLAQAARLAGLTAETLTRWEARGQLVTDRTMGGRSVLIDRVELDRFLAKRFPSGVAA